MTYARMAGDWNIVYHETLDYAFKHGEPELFRMSRRCDYDCCSRIVDMTERWSSDTEEERKDRQAKIIEEFGLERCEYIMAATVRGNSRVEFSGDLQKWAESIRISDDRFVNATNTIISRVEPILDFIATVQRLEEEEKKKAEEAAKAAEQIGEKAETEKNEQAEAAKSEAQSGAQDRSAQAEAAQNEVQDGEAAAQGGEQAEAEKAETEKAETERAEAEKAKPAPKRAARTRRTAKKIASDAAKTSSSEEKNAGDVDVSRGENLGSPEEAEGGPDGSDEKPDETKSPKEIADGFAETEPEYLDVDAPSGGENAQGAETEKIEDDEGAESDSLLQNGGGNASESEDMLEFEIGDEERDDLPSAATRQYGRGGDAREDIERGRIDVGGDEGTYLEPDEEEETEPDEEEGEDEDGEDGSDEGETLRDPAPATVTDSEPAPANASADGAKTGESGTDKRTRWTQVPLPPSAVIQDYGTNFYLRMPREGEMAGYAYNLPASLVSRTDTGYVVTLPDDFEVRCRRGESDPRITLTPDEYVAAVVGYGEEDYRRRTPRDNEKIVEIRLPKNALMERRERSFRFTFPDRYVFFVGKSLVSEDNKGFTIRMNENYRISAYKGSDLRYYTPEEAAKAAEEADWEDFVPVPIDEWRANEWQKMRISKKALVYENEKRMLFRMPDGDFEDCSYYYPKKLVADEGDHYIFRLPPDFKAELIQEGSEVAKEMDARTLFENICGKGDECYTEDLEVPSRIAKRRFEYEQRLRDNVPEEMRKNPNWVVVRTAKNAEKDKLDKFLISPVTGKFAESDNPSTWTDFETACRYARENGGDTLAYALDGKGVVCLDIDRCLVDNLLTAKAATAVDVAPRGTYMERSVSGNGLHIFGKLSDTIAIRSFSKDGDMEFYRKSHFIAMTGSAESANMRLLSFDTPQMKVFLRNNFDKRVVYKNAGQGLSGVSVMSDRELLDKAFASKGGDVMKRLFNGEDLQNNHSNSDMALMNRLAFWCNGDKEQMMRLFCASGLYRPEKSQDYYECTVLKALEGVTDRYDCRRDDPPKRPDPSKKDGEDKGDKT